MTAASKLRAGALGALLFTTALTGPALAQSGQLPRYDQADGNGVDLVTGTFSWSMTEGSIGSGEGALALTRNWAGPAGWTDNWTGILYSRTVGSTTEIVVEFGTYADTFSVSGSTYTSTKANGATLADLGGGYRYTASDGTRIDFSSAGPTGYALAGPACARASSNCAIPFEITRPNGMTYTLNWDVEERCLDQECVSTAAYPRFRGVSNSANYSFTLSYATDTPGSDIPVANWFLRTGAQFTNLDTAPGTLPSVSYSGGVSPTSVTDIGGQVWAFTYSGAVLTGIRRPGASSDTTTIYYSGGRVSGVTREGVHTSYSWWSSGSGGLLTITDGAYNQTLVSINLATQRVTSVFDPLERTFSYGYDSNGRLTGMGQPDGNGISYSYDARGNVTQIRAVAKLNSGLPDMVTSASYDSSCSNPITCNQPNSATDARGNTTDFAYSATHGGVLTVTAPAPGGGGDRPQTRYAYSQVTAVTGQPVYLPTEVSACASGTAGGSPTCVGTANEARTVTAYDTDNLRVTSVTARNGDNSVSAASAFTYDQLGNLLTVDGPLSGTADTSRFRYDDARRVTGVAGPNPDGAGSLTHLAERRTYTNGLLTKTETGTVNSQSDTDWAAFAASRRVEQDYDANARPTVSRLMSGSTTHSLTQTSYDVFGRVECVAQRMNRNEFGASSLPSDACTLDTQGSGADDFGPDRITRTYYDAGGQIQQVRTGYAVSGQEANEATMTYTGNGAVATLTDAEGNRTTYEYDGHGRPRNLRYPSPTTDGVSAPTSGTGADYEQITYATASVGGTTVSTPFVAIRRTRAGEEIGYSYDALGRVTVKTVPERSGLDSSHTRDVYYGYDLMGRLTDARFDSLTGQGVTNSWDALGRLTSTTSNMGGTARALGYQYDPMGNRTRITHPDDNWFGTLYNTGGWPVRIAENNDGTGAASTYLATFYYNPDGTPESTLRGMTSPTSDYVYTTYGRDAIGRLTGVTDQFSDSSAYNVSHSFGYDPASGIVSQSRDADAYAWGGHYAVNRAYTTNGLNQYSQATSGGGTAYYSYDANGNLATTPGSGGTITYSYDVENRLVGSSTGAALAYDPLGRLWQTSAPGYETTRYLYDGDSAVAEYDGSGNQLARYVHGPAAGADDPMIWYGGSTVSAGNRRYLIPDRQGSIIAVADGAGSTIAINRYDEYGIPASGNSGRFQYTGQAWLAELGMYYYRARIYSPTLGRFLQTDPIGTEGGMNLYAYVGNDPANRTDPSGLLPPLRTGSRIHGGCGSCMWSFIQMNGPNLAAERRRNDSIPWTATGTLTTYSDGSQTFAGSVTFGGRLSGTTLSLGSNGFASLLLSASSITGPAGTITHAPIDERWAAAPSWWARFDAADGGRLKRFVANYLAAIMSGLIPGSRATLEGTLLRLPGGRNTFYQRYEIPGVNRVPSVFNGARVAWEPGNLFIYLGPYHGNPTPEIPDGWIRFMYVPRER